MQREKLTVAYELADGQPRKHLLFLDRPGCIEPPWPEVGHAMLVTDQRTNLACTNITHGVVRFIDDQEETTIGPLGSREVVG